MGTTRFEDFVQPYRRSEPSVTEGIREAAGRAFDSELSERRAIGAALAAARRESGATQQSVADAAGIQQAELSRIENGLGNPTVETLLRVLAALDLRLTFAPVGDSAAT